MATGVEAVASASLARSKKAASDAGKHISRTIEAIDGLSLSARPPGGDPVGPRCLVTAEASPAILPWRTDLCHPQEPWRRRRRSTVTAGGSGDGAAR